MYNDEMVLIIPPPEKGKPLIKVGQKVDFATPLYEEKTMREVKVYISQKIDVSPKKIFQYVKKLVGDSVDRGEIIAEKKAFMGGKSYKSEVSGILKEINHVDGSVLIDVATSESTVLNSFFKGEITSLTPLEIHLKVEKSKEYEAKDQGGKPFGGPVFYMKHETDPYSEEEIAGRVIVSQAVSSYTQMKMEALGASGFVTLHHITESTEVPRAAFKQIKDYEDACKHKLSYCFVNGKTGKIVFYS